MDTNWFLTKILSLSLTLSVLNAEAGYVFYRLAYKNSERNTDLGFYLSVVKDGSTTNDGSRIKTTPGKGYLKVAQWQQLRALHPRLRRRSCWEAVAETTLQTLSALP